MGKLLPHSSFTARRGESKASISGRLRVFTEDWLPLTKSGDEDAENIEVTLDPGVYLLVASFVLAAGTAGELVRGRFYNATKTVALLGGCQVRSNGDTNLHQFSKTIEITTPTTLQFHMSVDEELEDPGSVYGGSYGDFQTGIEWARL